MSPQRKIIHCDCDCFYAAVEMRDDPSLRGRPLAVGGRAESRGVVATCNYEARKYGVHSAMASAYAQKICPDIVFVKPRMAVYRQVSQQVREVFSRYTEIIEPLSLDEAYLDVSGTEFFKGSATRIAQAIQNQVADEVGITLSAGVAPNKFLAKIASDWNKPNGLFVILPHQVESFLHTLPVTKLHGVGKVTAKKLHQLDIHCCGDIRQWDVSQLSEHFGSFGETLWNLSWGRDDRAVTVQRIRKSLSVERTYAEDLPDLSACLAKIPDLVDELNARLEKLKRELVINKGFVKIKFANFTQTTLERNIAVVNVPFFNQLCAAAYRRGARPVRLLGVGVRFEGDDLLASGRQLSFDFNGV